MKKLIKKILLSLSMASVGIGMTTALVSCSENIINNPTPAKSAEQIEYENTVNKIQNTFLTDKTKIVNLIIANNAPNWSDGLLMTKQIELSVYKYLQDNANSNPDFSKFFDISQKYNNYLDIENIVEKTVKVDYVDGATPRANSGPFPGQFVQFYNSKGLTLKLIPKVQGVTLLPINDFNFYFQFIEQFNEKTTGHFEPYDFKDKNFWAELNTIVSVDTASNPLIMTGGSLEILTESLSAYFINEIVSGDFIIANWASYQNLLNATPRDVFVNLTATLVQGQSTKYDLNFECHNMGNGPDGMTFHFNDITINNS